MVLSGHLDGAGAEALSREVRLQLDRRSARGGVILFDLHGVTDSDLAARPVLVELQKFIATRARRTAWMDDRPFMKGMALWIVHFSGDQTAKVVETLEQAKTWFALDVGRVADAVRRTERR
jgi:hypothetical protein